MIPLLQKHKKRFSYIFAIMLGFVSTIFVVNNDKQDSSETEYIIINKVNADVPYSQSGYYGGGDDGGGDDGSGDTGGDTGGYGDTGGGDVSDEYT